MKYENEETTASEVADTRDEEQLKENNEEKGFICRSCEKPMVCLKESSVQCEILKDVNMNGFLTVNDARRGSIQSVTEVREDVGFSDNVSAVEENAEPNEIVLVTRSFENEGQLVPPPRRSSISQFFSNIKTLGTKPKSDQYTKKQYLDESDAEFAPDLRSGIRRGSVGLAQGGLQNLTEINLEQQSDDNVIQGPHTKRKSVQLCNGQIVQEESEERAAELAIKMDEDVAPGEITYVCRSFETTQENQPRRESIIDKLNFVKMLGKNRKRKDKPATSKEENEDEYITKYATSGVRRKSIAPAALVDIGEVTVYEDSDQEEGATATAADLPDLADVQAARYVTSGIRRGSVAAVSAAPPCITQEPMKKRFANSMLHPDGDEEQTMRYVTSGIRRDSVAAVSAAPPCKNPEDTSDLNDDSRQSNDNIGIEFDDQDNLRSGVRRRSLIPAADGSLITSPASSPLLPREPVYNPVANETIYSSGDESDNNASDTEHEVEQNQERSPVKNSLSNEKGIHNLFESLTGRKQGVDYMTQDTETIRRNSEDEEKKNENFFSNPIPQITLSMDNIATNDDDADHTNDEDSTEIHV